MYSIDEINNFIKNVLKTDTLLTNDDLHEFIRLLSGGVPFKKYLKMVKAYDIHKTCPNTWPAKTEAYRCETCSHLTVMAMCKECFEPERHQGHKYHIFFSIAAGKCDCGNADIMDPEGFCHRSGDIKAYPPDELIFPAVLLLPPFISKTLHLLLGLTPWTAHSLYQKFMHRYYAKDIKISTESREFVMLSILERMSTSSDTLRGIICEALTNKDYYNPRVEKVYCPKLERYNETIRDNMYGSSPPILVGLNRVFGSLKVSRTCMLDSFFVWAIKEGFQARILKWFLTLTSDHRFKWGLAKAYVDNYILIMTWMKNRKDGHASAETLAPLALEIVSWPTRALDLMKYHNFMGKILRVLLTFLSNFYGEHPWQQTPYRLYFGRDSAYFDFKIKYPIIFELIYKQANDDFIHFLNHRTVAYEFLFDSFNVTVWLVMVKYFQGMHPVIKDFYKFDEQDHVIMRAFTAQVEICLHPMWTMLHHFKGISQEVIGLSLFHPVLVRLQNWIKRHELNFFVVFYHIPFHRIFSIVLFSEMMVGNLREKNVQLEEEFLKRLVHSPIRLWAASAEQMVYKWLRNSSSVRTYSKLYKFTTFCCSTVDPDIFLVQFACTQMPREFFVQYTLENFDTLNQLISSFASDSHINKHLYLLDEVLFYFAILTNARVLSGGSDKKVLQREIVNILSKEALTHTEFKKRIPYRGLTAHRSWESEADDVLQEVAFLERETFGTRNEPLEGQYHIKTDVLLREYDPVMVRMRSITSDEFNNSVIIYTQRLQKEQLISSQDNIWPPFRKPMQNHHQYLAGYTNFLNSLSLHGLLFVILYKCQQKMRLSTLQITIHLLNMALKFPYIHKSEEESPFLNNLYQHCLVQFDYDFNIVGNYGLFNLFDELYEYVEPTPDHIKETQYGYDPEMEELKTFQYGPKWYQHVNPTARSRDTILSLLLKLFKDLTKKTYLPLYMRGEGAVRYGSPDSTGVRIGGAEYFIGEVLDQLVDGSQVVLEVVEEYVAQESQNIKEDEEAKKTKMKKKAQAKKAQLMKKMAAKGKKFLETNEIELEPEDIRVKCIQCDQPMDSSNSNNCVMVYILRTQLLGHSVSEYHPLLSYIKENTFQHNFKQLYKLNKSMFRKVSLPIEWYDNLWIQSCNHPIHYHCYFKLMERTMTLEQQDLFRFLRKPLHDREVWCPYCRQLCNLVIPRPIPFNYAQRFTQPDHHLITSLLRRNSKVRINRIMKGISKYVLKWQYLAGGQAIEYINIYRNNIELYLMEKRVLNSQEETRSLTFTPSKKVNINVVHNLCSSIAKKKIKKEDLNDLFAIHPEPETGSEKFNNLALVDIKQLLAKSAVLIPTNRKDLMGSVICFYINLYLLQLLSWLAFCTKKKEFIKVIKIYKLEGTQLEYILNFMSDFFHQPKTLQVFDEPFMEIFEARLKDFLMFCHTVFSSVSHFDDTHLNEVQDYNTSELYAFFYPEFQNDHISSVQCFGWSEELFNKYLLKICHHTNFLMQITSRFLVARRLMLTDWRPPHFISLPPTFYQFSDYCRTKTEGRRGGEITLALCLICGEVCNMGFDKTRSYLLRTKKHTELCNRGCSIYLLSSNQVIIIWGQRFMTYNSPYINTHGEDKLSMDKTNDMTLDEDRLKLIERMWLLNYFDYFCKNWNSILP